MLNKNHKLRATALKGIATLLLFMMAMTAFAQNELQDIKVASLPNDEIQLSLQFSNPPTEPLTFTIDNPARIALDFPATNSVLTSRFQNIGIGIAQSVNAAEAKGRTRVVVNLSRMEDYKSSVSGNNYILTIGSNSATNTVASSQPQTGTTAKPPTSSSSATNGNSINNVDFRRGSDGAARIIVNLSDANIPIDLSEQGGRVIVDFGNTSIPNNLSKRWDVVDFSTPVKLFEPFADGSNAKMIITPDASKEFEHLAYQSDNQYVVEVREIPEEVVEQRKKDVFEGERLSLNFQDIEVRSVLQLIADFTNLNMVVSDAVSGNLTLRLKNVPWDQALDIILKTKGLGKRENGNVIYVAPSEEIAAREKLELEAQQQVQELAPLRSEFIQVNYARAGDLASLLKSSDNSLLSERGNVSVDERTNNLLVQDTTLKLNEIRRLVERLDVPVKQVLIESRIVIATDDFSKSLGVRFGVTNIDDDFDGRLGNTGVISGGLNATTDAINGDDLELADRLNVNLPAPDATASIGLALAKLPLGLLLELELSAAQAESRAEVISTPRVIASNQTTARIEQGTEIPFQSATSSGATDVELKKAVLSLEVTPQITPDDRVSMKLVITNDSVGGQVPSGFGGFIPFIDTNEIETDVLVDNGQTIVLGGVYEQDTQNSVARVPFFADLPFVGVLFRSSTEVNNKSELLVFITPKIISEQLGLVR
ncbi:MAG: type IV pilus secretin PilQ [Gammaproteobacteria bacterium]|nr:MAG: type IV pilus secretin PilQ [Gammaproteobacteria bacterium]